VRVDGDDLYDLGPLMNVLFTVRLRVDIAIMGGKIVVILNK
jgi:hypothetical protein